jgi:hypothetical protein
VVAHQRHAGGTGGFVVHEYGVDPIQAGAGHQADEMAGLTGW